MFDWFKKLWNRPPKQYKCPKCGSTHLGYGSIISNFIQVVREDASPKYKTTIVCTDCGYKTNNFKDLK